MTNLQAMKEQGAVLPVVTHCNERGGRGLKTLSPFCMCQSDNLIHNQLRICVDKKENSQKSETKPHMLIYRTSLTRKKAGVSLVNSDGITIFAPVYYNKV